jgi:hydroxyacylglutathione hydrolase
MTDDLVDFATPAPIAGSLDVRWIHGAPARRRADQPRIQTHRYDEHTVILRQSKALNYEAPFMFLLFGNERALLLDTGATEDPDRFPLRETVDRLVSAWLEQHPRDGYELVVAHTHGHNDHVAGDGQFSDRPQTTVVPVDVEAVRAFFGFDASWPAQTVTFDLGGRVLEVIGTPGHHEASITFHDPWTGILLTGDTVLPGRLFAFDFPAYLATLDRLVAFAETRTVTHVLGCHVEMTRRPGRDYPIGAAYQPEERRLEMSTAQLAQLREAAGSVADQPGVHRFDDFIIYNQPRSRDLLRLVARGRAHQVARSLLRR